jgi:hypothetical protein
VGPAGSGPVFAPCGGQLDREREASRLMSVTCASGLAGRASAVEHLARRATRVTSGTSIGGPSERQIVHERGRMGQSGRSRTHRHPESLGWGPKGRRFKSGRPDSLRTSVRSRQVSPIALGVAGIVIGTVLVAMILDHA